MAYFSLFCQKCVYFGFGASVGWSISGYRLGARWPAPPQTQIHGNGTPPQTPKFMETATIFDKIIIIFEKRFGLFLATPKHRSYLTLRTRDFVF